MGPSERDFLAAQADAARQALSDTLRRMQADLKDGADIAAWARRYPWPTLGVAAAAGFFAAQALGPKRTSSDSNVADLLAEALAANGVTANAKPSIWSGLVGEILRSLTTALEGAIAGAFSSKMQQAAEPNSNGHQPPVDAV